MTLNGGSPQEMIPRRPIFYFRTPVSLGSNYIEVSMVDEEGTRKSQAVVLFRDPKLGRGFQVQFPTYHFHIRENEKSCGKCYELTPPESSERNFLMVTQRCLECHTELAQKNYVHGPITVGGCSPCHDFASQPERYDLVTTGAELCYSCHEEKRSQFARSFLHGPLAAGVCSVCHSPHGSNEKFQLRLPEGQMCMLCHQQIKPAGYLSNQHAPFEDGHCSGCHNPHATDSQFLLPEKGCSACHSY